MQRSWSPALVAVLLAVACTGEQGGAGPAGRSALVAIDAEPAGENCAAGGQAIRSGIDQNGNGVLDAEEAADTRYVCNGAAGAAGAGGESGSDGRNALVSVEPEPAGGNCARGGQAIRTGLDLDSDGNLAPSEVLETRYVCHGQDGQDGESGQNGSDGREMLFLVVDETAGSHCPHGGKALQHGLDLDRDGSLDAA